MSRSVPTKEPQRSRDRNRFRLMLALAYIFITDLCMKFRPCYLMVYTKPGATTQVLSGLDGDFDTNGNGVVPLERVDDGDDGDDDDDRDDDFSEAVSIKKSEHHGKEDPFEDVPLHEVNMKVIVQGKPQSLDEVNVSSAFLPIQKRRVFVVGLPKAGTSTLEAFFRKAGFSVGHWKHTLFKQSINNLIGVCMRNALKESRSMLESCGNYDVWAQMDVTERPERCVYPQITYLEELHKEAPEAVFILNRRNLTSWASSISRWAGRPADEKRTIMSGRLVACEIGPEDESYESLSRWHLQHIERIRKFVRDHPSHPLLEIDIEDPATAERMAKIFQLPSSYWGHANKNKYNKVKGTKRRRLLSAGDDFSGNATDSSVNEDYDVKSKEGTSTSPPISFIVVVTLVAVLGFASTFWIRYQSKFGLQEHDNATLPDMELEDLPDRLDHPGTTATETSPHNDRTS